MTFFVKLFSFMTKTMEEPVDYGWFHIVCICLVIFAAVMLCKLFKDCSDDSMRRITVILWGIIVSFEVYKQLIYGIELAEGKFTWDYAWYAFPFQFCSSPLYILPIIAFSKNEKLRDWCIAFMMTFSLFAGLAVMCYPNDVFVETIGINIQTMLHHGSQVFMGIFYLVKYRSRLNLKFFFGGVKIFVVMVFVAMILNILVYRAFGIFGIDETFNMFYISPYFDCTLPLLSLIWGHIPYVLFVMLYFFGFILCALIVYGAFKGLSLLSLRIYSKINIIRDKEGNKDIATICK